MSARRRSGPSRRSASGLTLIELMVAMVIGLVIVLAAVAALTVARRGFTTVDAASQLRDNGRFASDLIQRIGEQAGYRDFSIVASKLSTDATREPSIAGFNNALLVAATPTTAATARTTGTVGYGSDILILRYQASQLYPNTDDPLLATVSDKSMIDCAGNNVATVPDPRNPGTAADSRIVSIFHVALNNGEPTLMCTYSPTGAAGSWTTVPLIQGVENFQVLYGVDRVVANTAPTPAVAASAPDVPDRYLRADQIGVAGSANDTRDNWRRVRSVRIGMVLRTPPGATQDRDTQTFYPLGRVKDASGNVGAALATTETDAGTNFAPTPDGRLRQSVTFTFHLRNDQTSDPSQRGVSLIVVLLILVVVSVLGVGGAQIALMAERGSRNDRDMQVAWQAAEAALMDAEFDIHGPNTAAASRRATFDGMSNTSAFVAGCGTSANTTSKNRGLCQLPLTGKPAWLTVDFTLDSATSAPTTAFGTFTGRSFASVATGGTATGVQPAKAPRYVIEPIPDILEREVGVAGKANANKQPGFIYRVTAMGFGPRADIQALNQILYRD